MTIQNNLLSSEQIQDNHDPYTFLFRILQFKTPPNILSKKSNSHAIFSTGEAGRVEAYAVAEVKVYDNENQKVSLTEAATIRIPVSDRFDSVQAGDQVPAWYFNEAIGEWIKKKKKKKKSKTGNVWRE